MFEDLINCHQSNKLTSASFDILLLPGIKAQVETCLICKKLLEARKCVNKWLMSVFVPVF